MPTSAQLQNESGNIDVFKKSKPELVIHDEESVDDRLRNIRIKQFLPGRFLAVSGRFVFESS